MADDRYLRGVLTVIAGALVYLCVVMTPWPSASAQTPMRGTRTPGESTGPAEVVIVGWNVMPDTGLPVSVIGGVTVANDVAVKGRVETIQVPGTFDRVVLAGWEPDGPASPGTYTSWSNSRASRTRGLPVVPITP